MGYILSYLLYQNKPVPQKFGKLRRFRRKYNYGVNSVSEIAKTASVECNSKADRC